MDPIFCAYCGKEIPADIIERRHDSAERVAFHHCNRACDVARRKRDGLYKKMSAAGKEKRSEAVTKSNHEKPRRKRSS